MPHNRVKNPFSGKVKDYLKYEKSPRGKLRSELIRWQVLNAMTKPHTQEILDFGCGTGTLALTLAQMGHGVTVVDLEIGMIQAVRKRAHAQSLKLNIIKIASGHSLIGKFPPKSFDLIICHSVLEFLPNPKRTIRQLISLLKDGGKISIEVASRNISVIYETFVKHDFEAAKRNLKNGKFQLSRLTKSKLRSFKYKYLERTLKSLGLKIEKKYGVRIFSDYLPEKLLKQKQEYKKLKSLEISACQMEPFNELGRYLHIVAAKPRGKN